MIDTGYLFANDEKRLFINTCLGCNASCSYCYLKSFQIDSKGVKTFEEIIEMLEKSNYKIMKDTLITLGCFSECLDSTNKKETLKLVKYFLEKGNQVQLATKQLFSQEESKEIIPLIKYRGQFVVFVSCATISETKTYENGTLSPEKRFTTFTLNSEIPTILYIKPVLPNITIKDIPLYKEVILKYHLENIVVGSIFTTQKSQEQVHFSNTVQLYYQESEEEEKIIESCKPYVKVYRRSSEVMKYYKRKEEKNELE